MQETTLDRLIVPVPTSRDALTEILRRGAQQMLAQTIEAEVAECSPFRMQALLALAQYFSNGDMHFSFVTSFH